MVYTQNGVNTALKRKKIVTCYAMDESWRHYAKQNKPIIERQIPYKLHLHEVPTTVKFIET